MLHHGLDNVPLQLLGAVDDLVGVTRVPILQHHEEQPLDRGLEDL